MAEENGVQLGGLHVNDAGTSKGPPPVEEENNSEEKKPDEKVPFFKLFSFADKTDIILMILGIIGGIGNGSCLPIMTILFGDMINSFGSNQSNKDIVDIISKVQRIIHIYALAFSGSDLNRKLI